VANGGWNFESRPSLAKGKTNGKLLGDRMIWNIAATRLAKNSEFCPGFKAEVEENSASVRVSLKIDE
jgi:hypothetical protein